MMNIDFTTLTDDELRTCYRGVADELARRDREKRAKLRDNFKQAFFALQDAGIDVTYSDSDLDVDDLLLCWDGFYFSN